MFISVDPSSPSSDQLSTWRDQLQATNRADFQIHQMTDEEIKGLFAKAETLRHALGLGKYAGRPGGPLRKIRTYETWADLLRYDEGEAIPDGELPPIPRPPYVTRQGCWNCANPGHRMSDCPRPRRPNQGCCWGCRLEAKLVTKRTCPRCRPAWVEEALEHYGGKFREWAPEATKWLSEGELIDPKSKTNPRSR